MAAEAAPNTYIATMCGEVVVSLYALSNEHFYRRECFGGILYSRRTKESRFYNHIAAFVMESFLEPSTRESALESLERLGLDPRSIDHFINILISEDVLVLVSHF